MLTEPTGSPVGGWDSESERFARKSFPDMGARESIGQRDTQNSGVGIGAMSPRGKERQRVQS